MILRPATRADHAAVSGVLVDWWAGRDLSGLLQPLFLEHFASTSLIAEDADGRLAGFLVGFASADDPHCGYVHFVGVAPERRGRGLGGELHGAFAGLMADRGVTTVRCVTSPINTGSVAFHERIGFSVESVDDEYVHLVRRLPVGARGRLLDPRPGDPAWGTAGWPIDAATVLAGSHVRLSLATPDDVPELFAALDDDAVWAHVRGRPASADELAAALAAANDGGRWPWVVRQGGRVVGTTSYLEVSAIDARLEIGFTLYAPAVWGTTVNPECKLLLMTWAFDHGFGRVQLKTDIRNQRSQRAIARLGARYEGVLRRYQRRADGSVRDTVVYSVVAEDWPDVRSRLVARLAI